MKKKPESSFIIEYRDVDPYTGHIDHEGVLCNTPTEVQAESIIAALIEYNTKSKHGNPTRQYMLKEVVGSLKRVDKDHWWTW